MAKNYNRGIKNLDTIKQALDEIGLDEVLKRYGIDTEGKNAICCPFHEETTPSFKIYDDRKRWTCFGQCSTGGDGFRFIQLKEDGDFYKAAQVASEITGIPLEANESAEAQFKMNATEQLNAKLNFHWFNRYTTYHYVEGDDYTNTQFRRNLFKFREELKRRCITEKTMMDYSIGYVGCSSEDDSDDGYENFVFDEGKKLGLTSETDETRDYSKLVEVGLIKERSKVENGEEVKYYEATLQDCLIFPIYENNKLVGFEGRNLNEFLVDKGIKYNKSATKFFLFNSDVVDEYEDEDVHLFEGIFDCLTAIQCGFPNSIGLLGVNALGSEEKAVLSRVKGKIYIHMDSDETGQKRADELLQELGHKAYKVEHIKFKDEKDLNGILTNKYRDYLSKMDEENEDEAYIQAISYIKRSLDIKIFGEEDDEGNIVGGAKNLVQIKLEEWEDNGCKPEQFQDLIKVIYQQCSGQSALIGSFKKLVVNKKYGISSKIFEDTVKEIKGEVALTVRNSSNIQNFESAEIRYEIRDNLLYKITPVIAKGEVLIEKEDVISTTVPIVKGILKDNSDGKEKVEVQFTNSDGQIIKIITPKESILKKNAIIDALGSKGLDVTDVTSQDIILWLRQYTIENSIPRKELVKMTGLYKVDGQYYYVCQRGEVISEQGLIDDFNLVYDSVLIDRSIKEITEINNEEWKHSINALPMIFELNERANTLALTSYMLSSVFREYFYDMRGAFSVFQVTGLKGSGKSTIIKLLMKMICGHNKPLNAKISRFVLSSNLSMSNAFILVMDEYKASDLKYQNGDLMYLAKCSYDSSKDEKGKATQDLNRYYYHRPMLIGGENKVYGEDSDAVKERAGIITFTNNWLKANRTITKPIVNELNKMDLSKFTGGYLQFALKLLNSGKADEIFDIAEKRAYEFSENYSNQLTDRHILTMTILAFGIELIKLLYEEANIESDITEEDYENVFKNALNHAINREDMETSLDRTMQFVATNLMREFPEDEKSFDASKHTLYLSRTTFLSLLETYRFQHKADIPEKSGLIQYIEDSFADEEGYIIEKNKGKTINGKTVRCIWIDTKKLSEIARIDEAKWLGMGVDREEYFDGTTLRVYTSEERRDKAVAEFLEEDIINIIKNRLDNKGNIVALETEVKRKIDKLPKNTMHSIALVNKIVKEIFEESEMDNVITELKNYRVIEN